MMLLTASMAIAMEETPAPEVHVLEGDYDDVYGKYRDSKLIASYERSIKNLSKDEKEKLLKSAIEYNNTLENINNEYVVSKLQHMDYTDPIEVSKYNNELKTSANGIMGTISIPKIAVTLPIYHWSSDEILNKGIGHIHGSSLPIGNGVEPDDPEFNNIKGSHCLLIGHRGLPSLKLFSDLDEMEIGDKFYIKVLGDVYAYQVYDIEVVLPDEVEDLKIEHGRDLCTLITCTPYGVNTHRILVKGQRVKYNGESLEASMTNKLARILDPKTVLGLGFILFVICMRIYSKKQKGKTKGDTNEEETFSNGT